MTNAENKNPILRWFEALNTGEIPLLDRLAGELFSPDFILHDPRTLAFELGPAGGKDIHPPGAKRKYRRTGDSPGSKHG